MVWCVIRQHGCPASGQWVSFEESSKCGWGRVEGEAEDKSWVVLQELIMRAAGLVSWMLCLCWSGWLQADVANEGGAVVCWHYGGKSYRNTPDWCFEQQNPLAAEAVIFTSCYMIWWPQCVSPFGKNDYFVPAADNRRTTDLVFSHNHPSSCAHCPHTNTHPSGHEHRNTASADIKLLFYLPKAICIHNQTPTDTGKLHTNTQSKAWEWKWKDEDSLLWDKSRPSPPAMFQV